LTAALVVALINQEGLQSPLASELLYCSAKPAIPGFPTPDFLAAGFYRFFHKKLLEPRFDSADSMRNFMV